MLGFPRTGLLCGCSPGRPGPPETCGYRGVCRHGDLPAPALKRPERSSLRCITSQGLRYQRLVSGSPGGRPCCRCHLYKRPGRGRAAGEGTGEGRLARQPLAEFRSFSSAATAASLGNRPGPRGWYKKQRKARAYSTLFMGFICWRGELGEALGLGPAPTQFQG